jgi:putative ABC transport system permease protein
MGAAVGNNRGMFWRILRRQIFANRGRLFVVLLALAAGAAITAALLNLQVDARRRLTTEFRAFGANVVITPRETPGAERFLEDAKIQDALATQNRANVSAAEFIYGVATVGALVTENLANAPLRVATHTRAVAVGVSHPAAGAAQILPSAVRETEQKWGASNSPQCALGNRLAAVLQLHESDQVTVEVESRHYFCAPMTLPANGGPEDMQIFMKLNAAQTLFGEPGHISAAQLSVAGGLAEIQGTVANLQQRLPDSDVRPIRQFGEAQGKVYGKISGLLTATVVLVLVLTALCVMAAMTNVAMERRNDVGLMKAIGGATRRVVRLFLTEAALLGLVGGLVGAALGILLSMELGKAVFGVAARPRLIVYPIAVGLTILVAIASSYPLRRLAGVRPAAVFRGEA